MHYNNIFHKPVLDESGVRMHMTTKLRKYNMGIISLGRSPESYDSARPNLRIPPNTRYEAIITCKPQLVLPIKVFAFAAHAHLIGKQIWAEQMRNGMVIRELGRSNRYDFSKQRFAPFDQHHEVLPGDTLRVHCVFDSSCPANATAHGLCGAARTNDTLGGWATENEMCFNFLAFYPMENAQSEFCTMQDVQSLDGRGGGSSQPGPPDRVCRGSCAANSEWALDVPDDVADDEQYNSTWHAGCECEDVVQP